MISEQLAVRFLDEAGPRLARIYGEHQASILRDEIISLLQSFSARGRGRTREERWNERDGQRPRPVAGGAAPLLATSRRLGATISVPFRRTPT